MKKYGAFIVFVALAASVCLGIDLSLAPGLSVKNLLLYVMVFWIVLEAVIDRRSGGIIFRQIEYMPLHTAMVLLIVLAAFSMLISVFVLPYEEYGIRYGVISLKAALMDHYLMLFVFLASVRDSKEALWMVKAVLALMSVVMTISLIEMFGFVEFGIMQPRMDGRLQGPSLGSNEYAPLMAFFVPITVVLAYLGRGKARLFWGYSAFVFVMVMFFAASRGALLGLVMGTFIGVTLMWRYIRARYLIQAVVAVSVVGAVAVAILAVQHGDLLYTRFIQQTVSNSTFEQTSGRTEIWADALALMSASPLTFIFGFGWATFDLMNPLGSHNEYLEFFFDLGIFGLALAVFIYFSVVYQVLSASRYVNDESRLILMGFLFGYLCILVSIVVNHMSAPWLFIWGQVGVILRFAYAEANPEVAAPKPAIAPKKEITSMRLGRSRVVRADV